MKLTIREEILVAAAIMHGYGLGHNDTVEGMWSGEDAANALEYMEEYSTDGGLLNDVEAIEDAYHKSRAGM